MKREIIEEFSKLKEKNNIQDFYNKTLDIITQALTDLQKKGGKINRLNEEYTKIFPMGDYTNDTYIDDGGELEVVIATSDPQIILNNQSFSKYYHISKTKKQKQNVLNEGTFDKIIPLFFPILAQYYGEKTQVLLINDGIKVLCQDEYGYKLLIRFATFIDNESSPYLSFWNVLDKRSNKVNIFEYIENMDRKDKETGGNYKKLVRIYKNIRKNILVKKMASSSDLNKYFVELIIYNIPDFLLIGDDIYEVFTKSVNYLFNCNIFDFKSFDGKNMQQFSLAKISYYKIRNFLNLIQKTI